MMQSFKKALSRRFFAILAAVASLGAVVGADAWQVRADGDVNLVANLPYKVIFGTDMTNSYGQWLENGGADSETDPTLGRLTDGKRASDLSFSNSAWHKCYRGRTRTIEWELPEMRAVTGLAVSGLQDNIAGLPIPATFKLYVSENGADYMLAYTVDNSALRQRTGTQRYDVRATDVGRFRAKYVRVEFECAVNIFIDEIEIYGTQVDGTEAPFVKAEEPTYVNAFDAGVEGMRELVLLYCGYSADNPESVRNTEEQMLYYFGYVGADGQIKDTFFDSFMFSALKSACPSGGSLNYSGEKQSTKEDWETYLASIFDEEYNCGAIERAVQQVKDATGKSDLQVSMVINIPYPTTGSAPFGDIDGDGQAEYCRNEEEQLAIYRWFFDRVDEYLAARKYQNIRLGAYYWEEESFRVDGSDITLVRSVCEEAHRRNVKFFWIPLLYANGYDVARETIGYDCIMMQFNYSFLDYAKEPCLSEIVDEVRRRGLGVEMEIHWFASTNDELLGRYYSYLNACAALGVMDNVAHSYYQNASPGTFYECAISSSQKLRNVYDDTYAFTKGTYIPRKPELVCRGDLQVRAGKRTRGYISVQNGESLVTLGDVSWQFIQEPQHGRVELNDEGMFFYYADADYSGTDSFTVCAQATYASSEVLTVNIQIDPPEDTSTDVSTPAESVNPSAESTGEQTTGGKTGSTTGLLAAAGVVALLAVGAAAALLHKKRKK